MDIDFSVAGGLFGLVGLVWLELLRIAGRASRRKSLTQGLGWRYLLLPLGFAVVSFAVAAVSAKNAVGAIMVGFGVPAGPVATGLTVSSERGSRAAQTGGPKVKDRVAKEDAERKLEEIRRPGQSSERPSGPLKSYFTEP